MRFTRREFMRRAGLDGGLEGPGDPPVVHDYRGVLASVLSRHSRLPNPDAVFPGHAAQPVELYA